MGIVVVVCMVRVRVMVVVGMRVRTEEILTVISWALRTLSDVRVHQCCQVGMFDHFVVG